LPLGYSPDVDGMMRGDGGNQASKRHVDHAQGDRADRADREVGGEGQARDQGNHQRQDKGTTEGQGNVEVQGNESQSNVEGQGNESQNTIEGQGNESQSNVEGQGTAEGQDSRRDPSQRRACDQEPTCLQSEAAAR